MIILLDPSKHRDPDELPSDKRAREMELPERIMCQCARCEKYFIWHEPWALCAPCKKIVDADLDAAEAADAPVGNMPKYMDRIVVMEKPVTEIIRRGRHLGEQGKA